MSEETTPPLVKKALWVTYANLVILAPMLSVYFSEFLRASTNLAKLLGPLLIIYFLTLVIGTYLCHSSYKHYGKLGWVLVLDIFMIAIYVYIIINYPGLLLIPLGGQP